MWYQWKGHWKMASAADEVMKETEAPSALEPGANDEMMEPSAVEAFEDELEAAIDAVDAVMVGHSSNNEGIDDSCLLSELLGPRLNQDSLESSSSLSPSPSTPSPPHSEFDSGPHGPQVGDPGQEVVAEGEEAGPASCWSCCYCCWSSWWWWWWWWATTSLDASLAYFTGAPRQFKIRLNYNEHRFIGECIRVTSDAFIGVHRQKTYSKKFSKTGSGRSWQEALHEVHKWLWEKWQIVESEFPLTPTCVRQVPGEVPADVLAELVPIIRDMPAEKIYSKAK